MSLILVLRVAVDAALSAAAADFGQQVHDVTTAILSPLQSHTHVLREQSNRATFSRPLRHCRLACRLSWWEGIETWSG
jgi:hypothetical protein